MNFFLGWKKPKLTTPNVHQPSSHKHPKVPFQRMRSFEPVTFFSFTHDAFVRDILGASTSGKGEKTPFCFRIRPGIWKSLGLSMSTNILYHISMNFIVSYWRMLFMLLYWIEEIHIKCRFFCVVMSAIKAKLFTHIKI